MIALACFLIASFGMAAFAVLEPDAPVAAAESVFLEIE